MLSIKLRNMFIIIFKEGKCLSKQKEKLEVVVNSEFYIHECLNKNGIMYLVNNLVILYMFVSVFWTNVPVVFLKTNQIQGAFMMLKFVQPLD